jgi:retron-type reverse transcriptase
MDAVAEIRLLASNSCEWVVDADIETCFDTKRSHIEWLELLSE